MEEHKKVERVACNHTMTQFTWDKSEIYIERKGRGGGRKGREATYINRISLDHHFQKAVFFGQQP